MGGGQKSETTVEQPKWYQEAAKRNLRIANQAAQIGYVPYSGPDVAAFTQPQIQGMQGVSDLAQAFGGPKAKQRNIAGQLMPAQDFGGGLKGYSSIGGYQDELRRLRKRSPGLVDYLNKFSVNRQTGAPAEFYGATGVPQANVDPNQGSDNLTWEQMRQLGLIGRGAIDPGGGGN